MKKYEIEYDIKTGLYRITALRNFSGVKKGDVGGLIEKESNLSHNGECWVYRHARAFEQVKVYGNAKIYSKAKVFGKAKIFDNANVYGNAKVYGCAEVFDNAEIFGNTYVSNHSKVSERASVYGYAKIRGGAKICGNSNISGMSVMIDGEWSFTPVQIRGTKDFINESSFDNVSIGCIDLPLNEWKETYRNIGLLNNYSEAEIEEYYQHLKHIETIKKNKRG